MLALVYFEFSALYGLNVLLTFKHLQIYYSLTTVKLITSGVFLTPEHY